MNTITHIFIIIFSLLSLAFIGLIIYQRFILPIKIDKKKHPNKSIEKTLFSQKTTGSIDGWPRSYVRLRIYPSYLTIGMNDLFSTDAFQLELSDVLKIEKRGIFKNKLAIIHKSFRAPDKIIIHSKSSLNIWRKLNIDIS